MQKLIQWFRLLFKPTECQHMWVYEKYIEISHIDIKLIYFCSKCNKYQVVDNWTHESEIISYREYLIREMNIA